MQMSKSVQPYILKQYDIKKEMGSGAYGHVWQVKQKKSGQIFALKKVFDAFRNPIDAQRTYRQVEVLHRLKHDNIIKLYRVMKSKNNKDLYLVFELMEADLYSVVGQKNILQKIHQIYIFYQILKGIAYMHSAQLIHRDLKPANVLINSQCKVKICDFGLIRSLNAQENEEIVLSQEVATKWYRAPQLLLGSRSYGKPVDMWSFGCIVAELLTGKPMFSGNSTLNQFEKILQYTGDISKQDLISIDSPVAEQLMSQVRIKNKSFREYFSNVDPDFYQLIKGALQFNPTKRLTAQQALKLPLFQQFDQEQVVLVREPIIPAIDDNIRFPTKAYREKIYDDIDKRYNPMPLKDKMNQIRSLSCPKKQREKQKSFSKKRHHSVKKQFQRQIQSLPKQRQSASKKIKANTVALSIYQKFANKYASNPYIKNLSKYSSISKHSSTQSIHKSYTKVEKVDKQQAVAPLKILHKEPITQSAKLFKKGIKSKLTEVEKKNILKSIGVSKPKPLQKYLK